MENIEDKDRKDENLSEEVVSLRIQVAEFKRAEEENRRSFDKQCVLYALLALSLENIPHEKILSGALELILAIPWLSLSAKGSIFVVENDPNVLVMKAQNGLAEPIRKACALVPFGKCICGQAALTREVQFKQHLDGEHVITYEGIVAHGHYCVPILSSGKVLGVMNLYVKDGHVRTAEEEDFLRAMADALAGMIERNNAEIEKERSELKFKDVVKNSFDPIMMIDANAKISAWNKGAELTFGYKESEVVGRNVDLVFPIDVESERKSFWEELKTKGFIKNHVEKTVTKSGQTIHVNVTASSMGEYGASVIARDVTREKMIDRMKSDFVSNVSHELRTPLTSIKGAVELVLSGAEGPLTDSQKEFLTIVINNSARLIKLISELLDLSKIESGKIEMDIKRMFVNRIITDAVTDVKALADKKEIVIKLDGCKNIAEVYCDGNRIRQVIINLIGNAIKFTPQGGTISVALQETESMVQVGVTDSGVGISKENLSRIFDKFQQVDSSSTRAAGGTGLGLTISKSIIEAHKGRIWVESTFGEGSTFLFNLPKGEGSGAPVLEEPFEEDRIVSPGSDRIVPAMKCIKKILVVDDDEDIARVIKGHLSKEGYEVIVANSGLEAVKIAVEQQPHLITLDVLMPNMDGYTVAELLKQNPKTKNIPIVIVSIVFEKERGYKLGVADYITKPFDHDKLIESIKKIERENVGDVRKRILIVDDDHDIVALLTMVLTNKGYHTMSAYDGLQAVAMAKSEKPDMIILDLMLPEIDGFEVVRRLKSSPETSNIPVITITGRNDVEDKEMTEKLGINEYLIKPVTTKALIEELDKVIEKTLKPD